MASPAKNPEPEPEASDQNSAHNKYRHCHIERIIGALFDTEPHHPQAEPDLLFTLHIPHHNGLKSDRDEPIWPYVSFEISPDSGSKSVEALPV